MSEISLDFWSILLVASALQGFVFVFLLLTNETYKQPSRLLAISLVIVAWIQIEFLFVRSAVELEFNLFYGTRHGVWLALGPLLYLYIRSFTLPVFEFKRAQLLHFLPFLVITLIIPSLFAEAIPEQGKYYGMLSVTRNSTRGLTSLQLFYGFLFFGQYLHASIYALMGIRSLYNYKVQQGSGVAVKKSRLRWMKRYSWGFMIILVTSLVYFIFLFYSNVYERWMDYLLIIPTTALMYILAYSIYKNPYLFRDDLKYVLSQKKYAKSGMDKKLAGHYEQQLRSHMEMNHPYRNPKIRLSELSQELSIPVHDLSQVINECFDCNFNEFINRHRVEEAKELLIDDSNSFNVSEVAYAVGFNNKASFNNYFKKITGHTPSAFQKAQAKG